MRPQGTAFLSIMVTCLLLTMGSSQQQQKEVVVIGGGIAGLSAARQLVNRGKGQYSVRVYEARRERYGGRVWTNKLKNPKARGLEVDLGAFALNVANPLTNPLLNLTRDLELETGTLGGAQFIVPWLNKKYSDDELWQAMLGASSMISDVVNSTRRQRKDVSVRQAVDDELRDRGLDKNSLLSLVLQSLNSYIIDDYSALHDQANALDFGYKQVLLDGMGELLDRLVSGGVDERPLKISLHTAVRQVKVDKARGKVMLRLRDGSQVAVDEVVVAVPAPVIASGELLFEPLLPREYQEAVSLIGMSTSNKIIVEFDAAFWPDNYGIFITAVQEEKERGNLQTWFNIHKLLGKPVLMGKLAGPPAVSVEKLSDEELQALVLKKLQLTFGEGSVTAKNIIKISRSSWTSDPLTGGSASYPRVGNSPHLWDIFAEPLCPNIYFAGEHTLFRDHGTLHGAYTSGVRAADQILSGYCAQKAAEQKRLRKEEERRRAAQEKAGDSGDIGDSSQRGDSGDIGDSSQTGDSETTGKEGSVGDVKDEL